MSRTAPLFLERFLFPFSIQRQTKLASSYYAVISKSDDDDDDDDGDGNNNDNNMVGNFATW